MTFDKLPVELLRIIAEFAHEIKPLMLVSWDFHAAIDNELIDARANHADSFYRLYPELVNEEELLCNPSISLKVHDEILLKLLKTTHNRAYLLYNETHAILKDLKLIETWGVNLEYSNYKNLTMDVIKSNLDIDWDTNVLIERKNIEFIQL